jgi:salicylate hydroxylase
MNKSLLIAGGGIGGMATAVAAFRAGWHSTVFEQATQFSEVGAGVQLGPNVTHILQGWGLNAALQGVAAYPAGLQARCLHSGEILATLSLKNAEQSYGSPYVTLHRADLHALLLQAALQQGVEVQSDAMVQRVSQSADHVVLNIRQQGQAQQRVAPVVVAADGIWSPLRQQVLGDGLPAFTGHLAYRAMVAQAELPAHLRSQEVSVWMGAQAHVVSYPVRGGDYLNVVCLAEGHLSDAEAPHEQAFQTWNAQKTEAQTLTELHRALRGACAPLIDLLGACQNWRLWPLCGRAPMRGPHEHVQGRLAWIGDAAHPMLPYLAQGAGMAIEDASVLAASLARATVVDAPLWLQRFAHARWRRNARVQARAIRNGQLFHATGLTRIGRDIGLRLMGASLMDIPWLYGYRADEAVVS